MSKKAGFVILVVILLLFGAAIAWNSQHKTGTSNTSNNTAGNSQVPNSLKNKSPEELAKIPNKTDAKTGTVIAGFPAPLIINSTKVLESYSIPTGSGATATTQYTARFNSDKSVSDEYNAYLTYLTNNKFSFANKQASGAVQSLYAYTDKAQVNVVVSTLDKVTVVTVSYLPSK